MRTLPLAALLLLAACTADLTATHPVALTGTWERQEVEDGPTQLRTHEWLELEGNGRFTWSTEVYGTYGRAEDGLVESFTRGGDWELRGDRLALRTVHGMGWRVDAGGYQLDYLAAWNRRQRVRLEGGRLYLTYLPEPIESVDERTLVFERARP